MANKKDDAKLKCSFCGKTQQQVRKLIAGPNVYICDQCIELCSEILDEELGIDISTIVILIYLSQRKLRVSLMNML